jgi:hypothetical protein
LHLSVIADALAFPDDGNGVRIGLTVINRGTDPTMLTHMIAFAYNSRIAKLRNKPSFTAVVNAPNIPSKLDVNGTWMGTVFYDEETKRLRAEGRLYAGVYASHSNVPFLIKIPSPKERDLPKKKLRSI